MPRVYLSPPHLSGRELDYLRDAIEKLVEVKVAKKRRTVGNAEELDDQVAVLKEALDDFIARRTAEGGAPPQT